MSFYFLFHSSYSQPALKSLISSGIPGGSGSCVYISRVEEGSVAQRAGLRPGDVILEVNGTPFSGLSHEDALKVGLSPRL